MYEVPRCKSCGGALDVSDESAQCIVCKSCGNVNMRSDAMKALEQAKTEIMSWLRKAIPSGVSITQSENIDPVARHNIFITNVRPNIESEFRDYRFGFINLLSNQLIAMPFKSITGIKVKHDSKTLFTFDAKIKSVESLSVGDDSKNLIDLSSGLTYAYALLLNNVNLIKENADGRYHFLSNNFKTAAESLEGLDDYAVVKERLEALSIISDGIADTVENKSLVAVGKLKKGLEILSETRKKASSSLDFGSMNMAILKEEVVAKAVLSMAEAINRAPELDSGTVLITLSNIINELDREEKAYTGQWDVLMKRPERYTDLFAEYEKLLGSKAGTETIKTVKGSGKVLVPFWVLEIKYSFVTGMLKKKSVEVSENMLISAVFPTRPSIVNNPRAGLTDIFSSRPETKFLDSFKGNETSISKGEGVKAVIDSATAGYSNNVRLVFPVSTRQEAELKCNDYLGACQSAYSKLKMGKATAKELIFIPCDVSGSDIKISSDMGQMHLTEIGDPAIVEKIML